MDYQTVNVRIEQDICYLRLYRPKENNTINDQMIEECHHVLDRYEESITLLVLEGRQMFLFWCGLSGNA